MENQRSLLHKVKNLIRNGDTPAVFQLLRKEKLSTSKTKSLTIIEAAYNEVKQAEIKGISTTDEIQIRKNKINNQLLDLIETDELTPTVQPKTKYVSLAVIGLLLVAALTWFLKSSGPSCPSYPAGINNKIMVLPFLNIGNATAKPHISLNKRINELTAKNNLSARARLAKNYASDLSNKALFELSQKCNLDLLVWGTYSSRPDSLRLVLEYRFTNTAIQNSSLVTLKDVTGLQKGKMLKSLDDAILSLCGLIALREGDKQLALKWFNKVQNKDQLDNTILNRLK